ncbi:hypothetical protein LLH23_03930 [bacterium]|nr:hypothetical protein [bacterium]
MRKPKYGPLTEHLQRLPGSQQEITLAFAEIEAIIGTPLPPSAREHRAWWGNEKSPSAPQKVAWQAAGWAVAKAQLPDERVVFVRTRADRHSAQTSTAVVMPVAGIPTVPISLVWSGYHVQTEGMEPQQLARDAIEGMRRLGLPETDYWPRMDALAAMWNDDPKWCRTFWMETAQHVSPKGHPFFRAAFANLLLGEKDYACQYLAYAYCEDKGYCDGGPAAAKQLSAYVALALLQEYEQLSLSPEFARLFEVSFDAAVFGTGPDASKVRDAVRVVATDDYAHHCLSLYDELRLCLDLRRQFASVTLIGAMVEALLCSRFSTPSGGSGTALATVDRLTLGQLLCHAQTHAQAIALPEPLLQVFHVLAEFRNRVHPGNERRKAMADRGLTPRIAQTVSTLMQLALIEWAEHIAQRPPDAHLT